MRTAPIISLTLIVSLFLLLTGCALFPYGLPSQGTVPINGRINDNTSIPTPPPPPPPPPPANVTPSNNATLNTNLNATNASNNATNASNNATNASLNATHSSNGSTSLVNVSVTTKNITNTTNHTIAPRPDDRLEIFFLNVLQGDATLVRIGNFTLLMDTGPANARDMLAEELQTVGVRSIDLLVISNWDADKIGGLSTVLRRFPVSAAWHDGSLPSDERFVQALSQMQKADIPLTLPEAGQVYRFGDLAVDVYNPQAMRYTNNPSSDSLALRLTWRHACAFLPSDLPDELEPQVVPHLNGSGCEIFKWRHHGEGRPTPSLIFDRLHPRDVVISVGPNSNGLPSPTTLTRLDLAGVRTWRTDTQGSIYYISDGRASDAYNLNAPANLTQIGNWYNLTYPLGLSEDG